MTRAVRLHILFLQTGRLQQDSSTNYTRQTACPGRTHVPTTTSCEDAPHRSALLSETPVPVHNSEKGANTKPSCEALSQAAPVLALCFVKSFVVSKSPLRHVGRRGTAQDVLRPQHRNQRQRQTGGGHDVPHHLHAARFGGRKSLEVHVGMPVHASYTPPRCSAVGLLIPSRHKQEFLQ